MVSFYVANMRQRRYTFYSSEGAEQCPQELGAR
jgi:hypothetical protein